MNERELIKNFFEKERGFMLFNPKTIAMLQQEIKKIGEDGEKTIYDVVKKNQKEQMEKVMPLLPGISGAEKAGFDQVSSLLTFGSSLLESAGFGKLSEPKIDMKNKSITGRIKNNPIAKEIVKTYGKSEKPQCTIICGEFAGVAEAIFGTKMKCIEKKCFCCGDRYCEFEVNPV